MHPWDQVLETMMTQVQDRNTLAILMLLTQIRDELRALNQANESDPDSESPFATLNG